MIALPARRYNVYQLKEKDFDKLKVDETARAVLKGCYEDPDTAQFFRDCRGFTMTQFKANITAQAAQNLLKMGIVFDGKPTAQNYKQQLGELLEQYPFLQHSDPNVCMAKILYWYSLTPAAEEEDESSSSEEKPAKKKSKKSSKKAHKSKKKKESSSEDESTA